MGFNVPNFFDNISLNMNSVSRPFQLTDAVLYSLSMQFNGSTCLFNSKLQGSSDPYNNAKNFVPPNWDDIKDSSIDFGAEGSFTYNVYLIGYNWVRLIITDSSGATNTGTLSATLNVKGPL